MPGPSETPRNDIDARSVFGATEREAYRFARRIDSPLSAAPLHQSSPAFETPPQAHNASRSAQAASSAQPAAGSLQKRPRGRILIALLMLTACASGILTVWDNLFRYKAYGVVTGRMVEISAPVNGWLKSVHVNEGDAVRQDDLLATISDLECEHRLARIADELKITEATLTAEMARIRWQSHVDETEMTRAIAEFHQARGLIHEESGHLDILRDQLERTKIERQQRATTAADLVEKTIEEKSHSEKIQSLHESLLVLKERADRATETPRLGTEQIEPISAKADMLLNEICRLREWMEQGNLRAPSDGVVLRRHHQTGECLSSFDNMFTLIEEASIEIELFVEQDISNQFSEGDVIRVNVEPFEEPIPCRVVSVGVEHRRPPEHIEIFYRSNVRLLPVHLKPVGPLPAGSQLKVGSVARLPHFGSRS